MTIHLLPLRLLVVMALSEVHGPRTFSTVSLDQQRSVMDRLHERYEATLRSTILAPISAMEAKCERDPRLSNLAAYYRAEALHMTRAWKHNAMALRELVQPFVPVQLLLPPGELCDNELELLEDDEGSVATGGGDVWSSVCEGYGAGESIVSHAVRDWSDACREIRAATYAPVVAALRRTLPSSPSTVLVPGAGMARLALDIAALGERIAVEAIECSVTMVAAARSMLARVGAPVPPAPPLVVFPNAARMLNRHASIDRLLNTTLGIDRAIGAIADDAVRLRRSVDRVSLLHAVFLDAVQERIARGDGEVDAVATVFFIDVCDDIVACVDAIARVLRSGGTWINFGPLKYHALDAPALYKNGSKRCEDRPLLSLDELVVVAESFGFVVQLELRTVRYDCDRSMAPAIYEEVPFMISTLR